MSIRTIALAAAVAALGTVASAENYFEFGNTLDRSSVLDLGLVRADADGVVEIYDSVRGKPGRLLGSKTVHAGANSDVRVNLGVHPSQEVIAMLRIDGEVVAERAYDIRR